MHWVIQDDFSHERGIADLIAMLERMGVPHSLHKVVPFIGAIEPDISPSGNVMVFGTYGMRKLAKKKGWVPGSFDLAGITYAEHVENWGVNMLNGDAIYCSFAEALGLMKGVVFMRPVVDSKFFSGMVTDPMDFRIWHHKVVDLGEDDGSDLRGSTAVMMATPKNIQNEYRIWIVDGEAVTGSLYKRAGRPLFSPDVEDDVYWFANYIAQEWRNPKEKTWAPARAYVMDVARTNMGLFIVETNTLNSAGLYCANVGKLISAIEAMKFP